QHSHSRPASIIHQHKPDDHQQQQPTGDSRPGKQSLRVKPDIEFSTEVDTLMKTIQSKPKLAQPQLPPLHQFTTGVPGWSYPGPGAAVSAAPPPPPPPPLVQQQQQQQQQQSSSSLSSASMFAPPQPDRPPPSKQKSRRKYECTLPNCRKSFYQKTHLDIHMRAHTGDKPFVRDIALPPPLFKRYVYGWELMRALILDLQRGRLWSTVLAAGQLK
ncbi:DNA-binding transcription factor, partial [Ophidiomyces ophidiicola]